MKVLGRVVAVLCLIHLQNMAFLGLKRRLRRPIPTLASNPNCVCSNGLRTWASATDTKTDT